jgi:hypothetical protein
MLGVTVGKSKVALLQDVANGVIDIILAGKGLVLAEIANSLG